ncbi:MAG: carbon-nitrogen hydrolase family protein [Candidatus Zixiibacteriota bacterium]|nr:MAG: carbon-nitrogen hydrolase family protein [candidate division Zixibacteria bacterium]
MINGSLKIALIQDQPGSGIRDPYLEILRAKNPDIIAFPEYYFVNPEDKNIIVSSFIHDESLERLREWSAYLKCAIIGGTIVAESRGKLYNRSYFVNRGEIIGFYDKIHPYKNEGRGLIEKGSEYKVFDFTGLKIGILICADVLYPASYSNIKGLKPHLIFVPTTSPYRENESPHVKFARDDRLFVKGAETTGSLIFKVCASGRIGARHFQARSLVATPRGIAWRNPPENEHKSALIYVNLENPLKNPRLDIEVSRP